MNARSILSDYAIYRKAGLRNAWKLSGMNRLAGTVFNVLAYVGLALCVLYLMSEQANAMSERQVKQARTAITESAAFAEDMRALLAVCLTRGDKAIWIGDELWIVGATPTGVTRKADQQ